MYDDNVALDYDVPYDLSSYKVRQEFKKDVIKLALKN